MPESESRYPKSALTSHDVLVLFVLTMLKKNANYLNVMAVSWSSHYTVKQINIYKLLSVARKSFFPQFQVLKFRLRLLVEHQMRGRYQQLDRDTKTHSWCPLTDGEQNHILTNHTCNPYVDVSSHPQIVFSNIDTVIYGHRLYIYSSTDVFFLSCSAESYSNPLAPEGHEVDDHRAAAQWVSPRQGLHICLPITVCECMFINHACLCRSKLTNDDFRKLLMTPRAAPTSAPPSKSRHHEWVSRTSAAKILWR